MSAAKTAKTKASKLKSATKPRKEKVKLSIEKHIQTFLEVGKTEGVITYEDLAAFGNKHKLSEKEIDNLLVQIEKESIDLLYQEQLDGRNDDYESFDDDGNTGAFKPSGKGDVSNSLDKIKTSDSAVEEEELYREKELEHIKELTESSQLNDPVKLFLKEIGKIPLLNKETEKVIADRISTSKRESIDIVCQFPFVTKELIALIERIETDPTQLKDYIQFSDFDEDNAPEFEKEAK